jgi:enamine deaminase RidA (YjgF/YER057c/UK114 family)
MRSFVPFDDLWRLPIEVPYSLLVKDQGLAWTCGQLPLDGQSQVLAPGDLAAQTEIVCDYIEKILGRGALPPEAIGKLLLYYVSRDVGDRDRMMALCRSRFGDRPVLVPIAVPHFYYEGLLLEVDVFAGAPRGHVIDKSTDGARVRIADGGEFAWAVMTVAMDHLSEGDGLLDSALAELDLGKDDRISEHWIAPTANADGGHLSATAKRLGQMRLISDEGALIMGLEHRGELVGELTYARAASRAASPSSRETSGVRVTRRQKGRFAWISARCLDGDLGLVEQTSQLMSVIDQTLRDMDLTFENVVKSTSHYVGGRSPGELHDNMAVRNRYYKEPGPASTGLPVFGLADPNSRIAVDILTTDDLQKCATSASI